MDSDVALLEALLFLQTDLVSLEQISDWLGVSQQVAEMRITELESLKNHPSSGVVVERVAGGFRLVTRPELGPVVQERLALKSPEPLSHAGWEVLAIIAYRQPITRLEIEELRQVSSERAIQTLVERQLIEEVGRKDSPGRPIVYGTTENFLREFGLQSPSDLPPLPNA